MSKQIATGQIMNEIINLTHVKYLLSLSNEKLGKYIDPINKYGDKRKKEDIHHYLSGIKKYLTKISDDKLTEREVPYCIKGCNRLYHSGTGFVLQQLACSYRNFIIHPGCKDYDMQSCHPTILLKLTIDAGLPYYYLKMYIKNRKAFLEENGVTKQEVLRLLNQDKPKKQTGNLKSLVEEVLKNKSPIIALHEDKLHINRKENFKNPKSSAISNILCYYENMLLHRVIDAGIPVSIPMYDGFITPPDTEVDINELNNLTKDFGIIWTNKELDTPFKLEEFEEAVPYQTMKQQFEEEVRYITDLNVYKRRSKIDGEWGTYTREKIKDTYKNWESSRMTSKGEAPCEFFDSWLKDPERLEYERCTFKPYGKKEDPSHKLEFNLFNGWGTEQAEDTGDFQEWFIDSYLKVFCDGEAVVEYVLNYIAHIIQYPERNPKVAIVLKGYEGTGKDSLLDFIQFLIGKRYVCRIKGMNEVFGDWNDHLANKIVLSMNETTGRDGVQFQEDLKEQITKDTINIREKFVSSYDVGMYWRMFVLSNNDSPVQYSPTDRRFLIIEIAATLMGKEGFWNTYHSNIRNKEKMSQAYTYFMNRDIEEWKTTKIPITDTMKNMGTRKIQPPFIYLFRELSKLSSEQLGDRWSVRSSTLNTACANIGRYVLGFTSGYKKKQVSICMEKKKHYVEIKNVNEENGSNCRHYVVNNPAVFLNHLRLIDCKIYKEDALDFSKLDDEYLVSGESLGWVDDLGS